MPNSIEYSFRYSLRHAGLIADNGNEQIGNRRCAHLAKMQEAPAFDLIEH
jgi:hypothetical protein